MQINYWDCAYHEYEESVTEEDVSRNYMCTHVCGTGVCELNNKWCDRRDECVLLDGSEQKVV
jgi:hypothetical protein